MTKKQSQIVDITASAGPRFSSIPNFGAHASVGPPSRSYRSPLSFGSTLGAAIMPSFPDDDAGADVEADAGGDFEPESDGDDDSEATDGDNEVGEGQTDADESDDSRSET